MEDEEVATGGVDDHGGLVLDDRGGAAARPDGAMATDGAQDGADATGDTLAEAPDEAGDEMLLVDDPTNPWRDWLDWIGLLVAVICGIGVFAALNPDLILSTTTATGGDMGSHVWGPAWLRDHLLPDFRLTGWTPDWYAGFPAYTFYMVVPSLFVVWLDVGIPWVGLPLAIGVVGGAWYLARRVTTPLARVGIWVAAVFAAGLLVDIHYNVAFKLVTVSGLVTLPVAAWYLARCAKIPFPGPPLVALGATMFLFEGGYSILGGNILSTMAGEFAFSIALTFAVLYLAILFRGIETGRDRALGAVLFGLVILNHLIPAIYVAVATVVIVVVRREDRTPWWDSGRNERFAGAAAVVLALAVLAWAPDLFPVVGTAVAVAMVVGVDTRALRWAAVVLPVGGLVAAFWFVPFYLNSPFLNDMGWEKYTNYAQYLWPQPDQFDMANRNLWFTLAAAGMILSLVHRVRLGWFLTLTLVSFGWLFVFLPQYRLWNARLLPFYFLCIYLLAALGVALLLRSLAVVVGSAMGRDREPWTVSASGALAVCLVGAIYLMGSLGSLSNNPMTQVDNGEGELVNAWEWGPFTFQDPNNASGWARYNYSGLEDPGKAWPEFQAMVSMMDSVGDEYGCGRAMWEYEPKIGRFGTPMAPMMLPYFTDSCIGSMEGLYFEASSTTPFHFINQSELSPSPSRAQRDLPYPQFDMDAGVRHLQLMGVKYYLAATDQAVEAARGNPDLTELASTSVFEVTEEDGTAGRRQWVVFEVADADLVVPLENLPVVVEPEDDHIDGWVYDEEREPVEGVENPPKTAGPAMDWYLDPTRWDVPLATSGPDDWPRTSREDAADAPAEPVEPAQVSDVEVGIDTISFTVDEPGSPVLVKTSFFPNWDASGAEGPWRVSPNFMVVVPTDERVTLSYGRTAVEWFGWLLTAVGVALVVVLARVDQRRGEQGGAADETPSDGPDPAEPGHVEPDPHIEPNEAPVGVATAEGPPPSYWPPPDDGPAEDRPTGGAPPDA